MNTQLLDDLARWETGAMSTESLTTRHPSESLAPLLSMHESLVGAYDYVPDIDESWARLSKKLPDRRPARRRRGPGVFREWLRKPTILFASISLASSGVAYAAGVEPVREAVNTIRDGVARVIGVDVPPDAPADSPSKKQPARDEGGSQPEGSTVEGPAVPGPISDQETTTVDDNDESKATTKNDDEPKESTTEEESSDGETEQESTLSGDGLQDGSEDPTLLEQPPPPPPDGEQQPPPPDGEQPPPPPDGDKPPPPDDGPRPRHGDGHHSDGTGDMTSTDGHHDGDRSDCPN